MMIYDEVILPHRLKLLHKNNTHTSYKLLLGVCLDGLGLRGFVTYAHAPPLL